MSNHWIKQSHAAINNFTTLDFVFRDGSCAIYKFQDVKPSNKKPDLVNYIRNCHNLGQTEVSAVEKWKNCIVTASYVSPCIHFWSMNEGLCSESETTSNKSK